MYAAEEIRNIYKVAVENRINQSKKELKNQEGRQKIITHKQGTVQEKDKSKTEGRKP